MSTPLAKKTKKAEAAVEASPEAPQEVMYGFKAYDANLSCRGLQYEIGKTYTTDQAPVRCGVSGFHWCDNPMDTWAYYDITTARWTELTAAGPHSKGAPDTKIASASITVGIELKLPEIIQRGIAWMIEYCSDNGYDSRQAASGNDSRQAASGYDSMQAASGYGGKVKLGPNGAASLAWHDGYRPRFTTLYAGESGIEDGVWYSLDETGEPMKVEG